MRCPVAGQESASGSVCISALHSGVRHFQPRLSADEGRARVHAAAGPAADRRLYAGKLAGPVHRREHPPGARRPISHGRTWWWSAACTSRPAGPRHHRARACGRQAGHARRAVGVRGSPEMYPDIDYLHIGEMGDATDQIIALLDDSTARPAAPVRFDHQGAVAAAGFPDPGLRSHPAQALPDADVAVLQRLPLSLRVLRHPGPLWPAAAAEDAAADHRRTRRHAPAGASAGGLFRRRQFRRQPQGRQGHAAGSGRMAEAARLSAAVRLRGDAQHRQAAGNSEAYAGSVVPRHCSSASRRRKPTRSRRCARIRTTPCR